MLNLFPSRRDVGFIKVWTLNFISCMTMRFIESSRSYKTETIVNKNRQTEINYYIVNKTDQNRKFDKLIRMYRGVVVE